MAPEAPNPTSGRNGLSDVVAGLVLALCSAVLLVHSFGEAYDFNPLLGDISRMYVPRLALGLMLILSVVLVVTGLRSAGPRHWSFQTVRPVGATAAAILLSAMLVWGLGLIAGGSLVIVVLARIYGYRRWRILLPFAGASAGLIWLMLGVAAGVILPQGVLWELLP